MDEDFGSHGIYALNEKKVVLDLISYNQKRKRFGGFDEMDLHNKRIRRMCSNQQQIDTPINLSDESPLPLRLKLTITPSFVNLIAMKLSQEKSSLSERLQNIHSEGLKASPMHHIDSQPISEKLKASNFSANLLKIGSWERVSRNEGDLVAKCYYAKCKLIWEVLDSGLKSKIEIQWSDITAIRATFCKNEPGILEVELSHPPLFFRETNPQPRKHTLWQATSDFTEGQAPLCRRHYLQFPEGTLERHYEKLLQCDNRLYALSQIPFPTQSSPYFSIYGGYHDYLYDICSHRLDDPSAVDYTFEKSNSLQFPYYDVTMAVPNFESFEIGFNESTSPPCSVADISNFKEKGSRELVEHGKSLFWEQVQKNQQGIVIRSGGDRIEGLPMISSANQNTTSLAPRISFVDGQEMFTPNNWVLHNQINVLAEVNSMHSLHDASMPLESTVEKIYNNYGQCYDQERIINNSMVELPVQVSNEYILGQLPQVAPYPYMFSGQTLEDDFAAAREEPNILWHQ